MHKVLTDTNKFATYIPFPTVAADHPKFSPEDGYWRGPVWLDQAYFAIEGIRKYGYREDASRFSQQLYDRLEGVKEGQTPIRENYHPLTGEGLESSHFSWSAAHLLLLLWEQD
jgi:putative isomerase